MTELSLIDVIEREMQTDDSDRGYASHRLQSAYEDSSDQQSIDRLLIALCGWSFATLKAMSEPDTPRVNITVSGGAADVEFASEGIEVTITDLDGES